MTSRIFELLEATSGSCRILVALAAPQGWHKDAIRQLAKPSDQVSYAFEGTLYADQPVWRTWTNFYWSWLLRSAGIILPNEPILGLVASPSCDLERIHWQNVAKLAAGT